MNLAVGIYDVEVAVEDGFGNYMYEWAPFRIASSSATFDLTASPSMIQPIPQGSNNTMLATVIAVSDSTANATLYIDGLPMGVEATFSPSNEVLALPHSTNTTTVTFTVSKITPPGSYPLTLRGVSGSETIMIPIGFGVMPFLSDGQGFATINLNPRAGRPGDSVTIAGSGFVAGNNLTLTVAPPGALTPTDVTPLNSTRWPPVVASDGTWSIVFNGTQTSEINPGLYIVKATDGTRSASTPYDVFPDSAEEFFIDISPQFLRITQGASGVTTFSLSSFNAFSSPVKFKVGGNLPPGVTAVFTDAAGNAVGSFTGTPGAPRVNVAATSLTPSAGRDLGVTVTLSTSSDTPVGPYQIFLEAASGSMVRGVPLMVQIVSASGTNIALNPARGSTGQSIGITGSGFTASSDLTVTFGGQTVPTAWQSAGQGLKQTEADGSFSAMITASSLSGGVYQVNVTDAGGKFATAPFTLNPSGINTFVLLTAPPHLTIPKGGSGNFTLTIQPTGTFASPVALSLTGLDAISGATSSFTPTSTVTPSVGTPTSSTLSVTIPSDATEGTYLLRLNATSGSITQLKRVAVQVTATAGEADFSISAAPRSIPILNGTSGTTEVTIRSLNEFSDSVDITFTDLPTGITVSETSITPSSATGMGKATLTFAVAGTVAPDTYTFTITGTSGTASGSGWGFGYGYGYGYGYDYVPGYGYGYGFGYGYGYGGEGAVTTHSTNCSIGVVDSTSTITTYTPAPVDPTTVSPNTPVTEGTPWGDVIQLENIVPESSEATTVSVSGVNTSPSNLGDFPTGLASASDRIINVESDIPVSGVDWTLNFTYTETSSGFVGDVAEQDLTIMFMNSTTGEWATVDTVVDAENNVVYATIDHFSDWGLGGSEGRPSADAGGPYVANEGSAITFDASDSSDSDGTIVSYSWDWDSDGTYDKTSTSATVSNTWNDDFSDTATLRVTDDEGKTGLDTFSITVSNVAPSVNAGANKNGYVGTSLSFSGSFTDAGTSDTHTIGWNFGDGSSTTASLTPSHSYSSVGTFTVTLTITDDDLGVGTDTLTVTTESTTTTSSGGASSEPTETTTTTTTATDIASQTPAEAATTLESLTAAEAATLVAQQETTHALK